MKKQLSKNNKKPTGKYGMNELEPCVPRKEWRFKRLTGTATPAAFIMSLILIALFTSGTWIFYLKPALSFVSYKSQHTMAVFDVYESAKKGDPEGLIKLEQMTHQDSGVANIILMGLYRDDAIKNSGINMKDPNADLTKVDTRKMDDLVLQAIREYSDLELRTVLAATTEIWDESLKPVGSGDNEGEFKLSTSIINRSKIDHMTTLTPTQKSEMSACYQKLEEKLSNQAMLISNLRSIGTCTPYLQHEPTFLGTYKAMFVIGTEVDGDD